MQCLNFLIHRVDLAVVVSLFSAAAAGAQTVGALDPNFRPVITRAGGFVSAVSARADGKVVIAGGFNAIQGVARSGLARLNVDGTLDAAFDPGRGACCGTAGSFAQGALAAPVTAMASQGDGKVIIGGTFTNVAGLARRGIARLNADGSPDATFDATAALGFGTASALASAVSDIVVQPDGRIIVAGSFSTANGVARSGLARFNANGTLDTSFDPASGAVFDEVTGFGSVATVSLQANGQIVVGGNFILFAGAPRNGIARLNANGSPDPAFDPYLTQLDNTLPPPNVDGLAALANGTVVVSGSFRYIDVDNRYGLARLKVDGGLDTAFVPAIGPDSGETFAVLGAQADGRVIAFRQYSDGVASRRVIARVNTDGAVDPAFGVALEPGFAGRLQVFDAAVQADGRWLVVGSFSAGGVQGIVRIGTDGRSDPTFAPRLEISEDATTLVQAVGVQKDGKVVIGGTFTRVNGTERNRLARLNGDGSPDAAFATALQFPETQGAVESIVIQEDGKIVIGGLFTGVNGTVRNGLARLNEDGTLDPGFNIGTGTLEADAGGGALVSRVHSVSVQTDGRMVVGGDFTLFNNTPAYGLVRLNADGSIDPTLAHSLKPCRDCSNPDVRIVSALGTGHVMISGIFDRVGGIFLNGFGRLLPAGDTDSSYVRPFTGEEELRAMARARDDKILLGILGVSGPGESGRGRVVRLAASGAVDAEFKPAEALGDGSPAAPISAVAFDLDGRVIVAGQFSRVADLERSGLARFTREGTVDDTFNAGAGLGSAVFAVPSSQRGTVTALGFQEDGGIIVGGAFATAAGQVRLGLARFQGDRSPDPGGGGGGVRPRLQSPARGIDGTFTALLAGEAGKAYRVEASLDLRTWSAVGNVTGASTPQPFRDPAAGAATQKYYRAVTP